jgi:hypothetical protein
MENQPKDKFINGIPFPVTPDIGEKELKEINDFQIEVL